MPEGYQKFDNKTPRRLNVYVIVQFLIVLAATFLFLYYLADLEDAEKIAVAFVIIFSVASFGLLFENRRGGKFMEYVRLFAMPSVFIFCLFNAAPLWLIILTSGIYLGISMGWFVSIQRKFAMVSSK